jgi:ABC-type glycerol-3-phosphate transport system permease component
MLQAIRRKDMRRLTARQIVGKMSVASTVKYASMTVLVAFTALPLIYLISTAFKPLDELFLFPPRFFVRRPTFQNFSILLSALDAAAVPFTRNVFNSIFITVVIVAITTILSSMGGFALAKYNMKIAKGMFAIIIAGLMFSPHVTQIPQYLVVNYLGLYNTYWALILPNVAVAYNFFLMKQFSEQIPMEYLESARMDGAREWRIFWALVMPLLRPAVATLVVLSFVANWNNYFGALVFLTREEMKTMPLAIATVAGGPGNIARAGAGAASALLFTAPTILIFVIMQSRVLRTMAYSGIKG